MSYSSEVLADSPLVYYKLDETSGTSAADSSIHGLTGVHSASVAVNQPSLLGDGTGKAAKYVAATNSLTSVNFSTEMNSASITVEARIKPAAASVTGTRVIGGRFPTSAGDRAWQLQISGGRVVFVPHPATGSEVACTGSTVLVAETAYTIAATWDGATVRVFVNGVLDGSVALSGTLNQPGSPSSRLTLGTIDATLTNASFFYVGVLDEFSMTGTALSEARLFQRHQAAVATGSPEISLAGTLPAVTGAFTVDVPTPPVDLSLAGTLPTVTGAFSLDIPAPTAVDLSLAGTLPTVTGAFTLAVAAPATIDLSLAGTLPTVRGAFTLKATATETATTETNNRANGRSRTGKGYANLDEPVAGQPATIHLEPIRIMSQTLSTPTLEKGRPV